MNFDPQQIVIGLANGSVYAVLALSLVLIYRSNGVINFAQGEMATFAAYIAWTFLTLVHAPFFLAVLIALAAAFALGSATEFVLIRRVRHSEFTQIIATVGLFIFLNSLDLGVWGGIAKSIASPFGNGVFQIGSLRVGAQYLGILVVALVLAALVFAFFRWTKVGQALEAATLNPTASRLVGINVGRMMVLGWGISALVGGAAGIMTANLLVLEPNMMASTIIFGFAAISLGGISSPFGAIVGGLSIGVLQALLGTYVPGGTALRTPLAFVVLLVILLVRPNGLFGRARVVRA
jgi:branched-chain amino acid transport system permease protein